jgi:Zn finger protein HypA/HybF involved in hydrogenase expression
MIKKCLECLKTFGREIEKNKCPFCKSNNITIHNRKVKKAKI